MAILNVPITNATCTRAELEAARLLNGLVAARIYYISNEQIYELATGPNTTIQYLPTTTTPGDIGAEPAITPKGTAFNQDFGSGSDDVCEGNDARLSDERDPTTHAVSHAVGGLDELTPAAIGAATAADVAGKVAKAGDTMTGDLNLISAKVLITDGGVRSVHSPFDYNDPSTGVGGFGLEDAGDASTTGGMVLMTNPATGTEEVTVGSVDGSTGLRLRAPHVVVDSQSIAVALEAAEAGSSIIVTGFTQTGEAILGAVQPPGTAYEEAQIDTRNLSLGTGDGTGAWVDVVVLDALTQECQDNLTQIIYQMYMANSSTAETKVEVGYRIDGADPTEWRLHDLGTSSSGVSISDVFQPPSNLLLGQVLTLTARRVGYHVDSTAMIQGTTIDASSFKVRVIQAAVSTGEANRGFALASPNVYHSMDGFNLQFRGMADTGDIEWSTPSADTLGADLTTQAGVTPGTYTYPTIQVDAKGRVVSISNQVGGGLDHGALGGLGDDDHTQYHNDARGDQRYAPLLHAFNHVTGGPDALTPADIGAEPEITPKGSAFNKDFGTVADTVCEGNDARLGKADSALQNVVEDLTPVAGGPLRIGEAASDRLVFTDAGGVEFGQGGYLPGAAPALIFARTVGGLYEPNDGGIAAMPGRLELHGNAVQIDNLQHTDDIGYRDLKVSDAGIIFSTEADVGWSATEEDVNDYITFGAGTGLGPWDQLVDTATTPVATIDIGDTVNIQSRVYVETAGHGVTIEVGYGIDAAEPAVAGTTYSVAAGFAGYLPPAAFSLVVGTAITTSQTVSVWVRRVSGEHNQSGFDVLGSVAPASLTLSTPSSGTGGSGTISNLSLSYSGNDLVIGNTGGTDVTLPEVVAGGNAGPMSGADKAKLDGLGSSAQVWTTPRVSVTGNGNSWPFTPDGQTHDYYPDPLYSSISFAVVPPANQDTIDSTSIIEFHAPDAGSWTFTVATGDLLNGFVPPVINAGDPPVSVLVRYLPGQISAQLSYLDSTDPTVSGPDLNTDRDGSTPSSGSYAWDVTGNPGGFVVAAPAGSITFETPINPPTLTGDRVLEFVLTIELNAELPSNSWSSAWANPPIPQPVTNGTYHIVGIYDGNNYTLSDPVLAMEGAPYSWWNAGGVQDANVLGAYQAIRAASFNDSLVNLADPGTNDLVAGSAPAFNANIGWVFDGSTNYLDTGITQAALGDDFAIIARIRRAVGIVNNYATGIYPATQLNQVSLTVRENAQVSRVGTGIYSYTSAFTDGVYATARFDDLAVMKLFKDGVLLGASGSAFDATEALTYFIGAASTEGGRAHEFDGDIAAIIYLKNPTEGQIIAVSNAMAAL